MSPSATEQKEKKKRKKVLALETLHLHSIESPWLRSKLLGQLAPRKLAVRMVSDWRKMTLRVCILSVEPKNREKYAV